MKKQEWEAALQQKLIEMRQYEEGLYAKGIVAVAGVDEVGRGPLAGPVMAAAVVLPRDFSVTGIDDSKKLSEKKREYYFPVIKEHAMAYGIGTVGNERIDEINILEATKEAMALAVNAAEEMLERDHGIRIGHILVDAITIQAAGFPQTAIIKGDSKSVSIAAASILAKVTRDRMMKDMAGLYPGYGFERNKGYGTKEHYAGIEAHGACPIHRATFLKNRAAGRLD